MSYEFMNVMVSLPDTHPTQAELTWADVTISFLHTTDERRHSVKVPVCIESDDSQSIAAAKQQALDHAKTILQAALSALQENDLGQLKHMEQDYDAREEARYARVMEQIKDDALTQMNNEV